MRFCGVDEQKRLREHMIVWLDGERCHDLTASMVGLDEVVLMQAPSGGRACWIVYLAPSPTRLG